MTLAATLYVLFLATSLSLGAWAARRIQTAADFYVAGARVPWYLLAGTFIASNVSTGLFLGATNMAGRHGYKFWCAYFTTGIGFLFAIAVVGTLVRRLAAAYEIYNFADILATRYRSREGPIRALTAVVVPLVYLPYVAAQFIGLAAITSAAFGLPYSIVLAGVVGLVVAYTVWGGMLGVVWTDAFQFLVLFFGMVLAVPIGMKVVGGGEAFRGWERIVTLSPDLFRWSSEAWPWYLVLGQFIWVFALAAEPHLVTRFLTARDEATILKALPACLTANVLIYASSVPVGLLGRLVAAESVTADYYYIELARNGLGPWLGAFALSGIAAAALSTCSTELIVSAQSISRDLYQKRLAPHASERRVIGIARLSVLIMGVVTLVIAYFQMLGIFWLVVLSASLLTSVFFVPLVGGLLWPRATAAGALAAMLFGGVAALAVYAVNQLWGTHFFISELYAGLGASGLGFWFVSRRGEPSPEELRALSALRGRAG